MNKPVMQNLFRWRAACILLAALCLVTTGCEPLRKKFVRKKSLEKNEVQPILDPVEYAGPRETVEGVYKYHYGLWQVWHRELITGFQEQQSASRLEYLCTQILTNLEGMQSVLSPEKKTELEKHKAMIASIQRKVMGPPAMRGDSRIIQDLMRMDNAIRREFNPKDIAGSLSK